MIAVLLLPVFAALSAAAPCSRVVACYYPGYRSTVLPPRNIDANVCTHIIFAFVDYDATNNRITTSSDPDVFKQLLDLKKLNPDLKLLVSLGGEHVPTSVFQGLTSTETKIASFAATVVPFLKTHGLDGLDVDWEFPSSADKIKFGLLFKHLRSSLGSSYLLTAAVTANYQTARDCYPIIEMEKYLNFVFEMSYNFHGLWERNTGLNSPLFGPSADPYTSDYIMKYWATLGISKSKLVMGIPAYGPQWSLTTSNTGIGAPANPGTFRLFNEMCVQNSSYTWVYDATYGGTFAYKGTEWVSMETPAMAARKAQYTIDNGFGGVMFWEIGQDDFSGNCRSGTFPLTRASKQILCPGTITTTKIPSTTTKGSTAATTKVSTATTTTKGSTATTTKVSTATTTTKVSTATTTTKVSTATTTTKGSTATTTRGSTATTTKGSTTTTRTSSITKPQTTVGLDGACPGPGLYPNPNNCRTFYSCAGIGTKPIVMSCGVGLVYNPASQICDWPLNVPSCT